MTNELPTPQELEITQDGIDAWYVIMNQKTPPNVIKTRKGHNGKELRYVSTDYVIRILNSAFGHNWDFAILDEKLLPNDAPREAIVKGQLTIHGPNGAIHKTQFGGKICLKHNCYACKNDYKKKSGCGVCGGTGKGDYISLADDLKSAASDALKKCASLLGVALDLYGNTPPAATDPQTANGNGKRSPKAQFANQMVGELKIPIGEVAEVLKLIGGFDESKIELLKGWVRLIVTASKKLECEPVEVATALTIRYDKYDPQRHQEQYDYVVNRLGYDDHDHGPDHQGQDEISF